MMYLYTGTPGSGKSYHVSKDISFNLGRGKNIIANFDYAFETLRRCRGTYYRIENFDLSVKYLVDFCDVNHERDSRGRVIEGQTWLIIDEAQIIFNARSWNDRGRQQWCEFFTQHRKYGYNIILATQVDRLIDRSIRSLCEYECKHRKVNNYGTFGFIFGLFFVNKPIFCVVEYWYGVSEKCGTSFMVGRKKYFDRYNTSKLFSPIGSGADGVRGVAVGRGPHADPAVPDAVKDAV